jgi:hypothetical protein
VSTAPPLSLFPNMLLTGGINVLAFSRRMDALMRLMIVRVASAVVKDLCVLF